MRCICCDNPDARWWVDNYYCNKCKQSIKDVIREDKYEDRDKGRHTSDDSSDLQQMRPQRLPNSMGRSKLLSFLWGYYSKGKTKDEL